MTLIIEKGITLRKGYIGTDDPDAEAYIAAVEAADEAESPGVGALETATKVAIHSFVKGCKNDGIWPAIKASCILAGARTRLGALTPLTGTAPTSFNFVDGDYDRKTGLIGNGSTKYLGSGRASNVDGQNNFHLAVFATQITATNAGFIGGAGGNNSGTSVLLGGSSTALLSRNRAQTSTTVSGGIPLPGLIANSRAAADSYVIRVNQSNTTASVASQAPESAEINVFRRSADFTASRLAFYSIGQSLDLALLDARVTTLINAFGAAIP